MKRILKYNSGALNTFCLLNFVTNSKLQQGIENIIVAEDLQYICKQRKNKILKRDLVFRSLKSNQ